MVLVLIGYALANLRFIRKHVPIQIAVLEKDLDILLDCPSCDLLKNLAVALWDIFVLPATVWGYWVLIGVGFLFGVNYPDTPPLRVLIIFILISVTSPIFLLISLCHAISKKGDTI